MDYDERSAGGIVFRRENNQTKWLLVKMANFLRGRDTNHHPNSKAIFKFPKGHLQKDEFLKGAALREVEEEGRVKAKILEKIGSNNYFIFDKVSGKKIVKKVTFFLMEFRGESNLRHFDQEVVIDRLWVDYQTALEFLAYDSEKKLLTKAKARLEERSKQ